MAAAVVSAAIAAPVAVQAKAGSRQALAKATFRPSNIKAFKAVKAAARPSISTVCRHPGGCFGPFCSLSDGTLFLEEASVSRCL